MVVVLVAGKNVLHASNELLFLEVEIAIIVERQNVNIKVWSGSPQFQTIEKIAYICLIISTRDGGKTLLAFNLPSAYCV